MAETSGKPKIQDFHSTTTNCSLMWRRNAATLSVNRMLQPSSHHMTASLGEPWGTGCPPSSHQLMSQQCMLKTQDEDRIPVYLAPDSWHVYQRNDFIEPRLLHLPIHRKALISLRCRVFFNSTLLIFWLPGLRWLHPGWPPHSIRIVLQSDFRVLAPRFQVFRKSIK